MVLNEMYTLSNGVEIPKLGLGTWMIDDERVVQVVKDALDLGYRHIDTAESYRNEKGVGRGIKSLVSTVKRSLSPQNSKAISKTTVKLSKPSMNLWNA